MSRTEHARPPRRPSTMPDRDIEAARLAWRCEWLTMWRMVGVAVLARSRMLARSGGAR